MTGINLVSGITQSIAFFSIKGGMAAGIVFLVLVTIAAVHAMVFRAYINRYKETYSIIETVG